MIEDDDALTDNVAAETFTPAHAHLELVIVQEGQREFRYPFLETEIVFARDASLAFPDGSPWVARLSGNTVTLKNEQSGETMPLPVGSQMELQDSKIWLVDARQAPLGRLEGITDPFTGRVWTLGGSQSWLGRRGKRFNHIELNHPTISRAHATFTPDQHGRVTLLGESAGSAITVNGTALPAGQTARLANGDLIGFGGLQFRFSCPEGEVGERLLNVNTMGTLQVALGAPASTGAQISTKKARWLMAVLAVQWGAPKAVETVLDWFWPDLPPARARKNLSHLISVIRDELGCPEGEFESLILRTPSTIALNPDRLGTHDMVEVKKLTASRAAITSDAAVDRLLSLYQGPFMPTCHEDWAHAWRQALELDLQATLLATGQYCLEHESYESLRKVAEKVLEHDVLNEEAARLLMQAYLKTGRPERAVKVYDTIHRELQKEGLEPDTDTMRLYYQATI